LGNRLKVLEDALKLVAYLNDKQVRRYRDVAFANGAHGKAARVELILQGGAWATREEVEEERRVRAERARKRRQTLAKNRAAKLIGRVRLAPTLRLPTRRDSARRRTGAPLPRARRPRRSSGVGRLARRPGAGGAARCPPALAPPALRPGPRRCGAQRFPAHAMKLGRQAMVLAATRARCPVHLTDHARRALRRAKRAAREAQTSVADALSAQGLEAATAYALGGRTVHATLPVEELLGLAAGTEGGGARCPPVPGHGGAPRAAPSPAPGGVRRGGRRPAGRQGHHREDGGAAAPPFPGHGARAARGGAAPPAGATHRADSCGSPDGCRPRAGLPRRPAGTRPNRRAAPCTRCRRRVPPGQGHLQVAEKGTRKTYTVTCAPTCPQP